MSSRIYKAKRKNWRELPKEKWWVEGAIFEGKESSYIITNVKVTDEWEDSEIGADVIGYLVAPETVCQYVDFDDKGGNKIFENDICEMVYDGEVHTYVVVWDKSELDFKGTNGKEKYGQEFEYLPCCDEIVIVGNIFDTPELMK